MADVSWVIRGKYRALVHSAVASPELTDAVFRLRDLLEDPRVRVLQAGRHVTYRLPLPAPGGRTIDAVVKRFGGQSPVKDLWDRIFGSKARRSYAASVYLHEARVGTIPPVACVECWRGFRLCESYFVSLYLADTVCFKDELVDMWRRGATYREFHGLMELVAAAIRSLHDAGCLHNDLGNQNIQLTRSMRGGPFTGVAFLDHNRARLGIRPSHGDRALDLARLVWPSGLFPEFFRLYWHGEPPEDFLSAYHRHWLRFRIHSETRRFRHPIREIRYKLHPETAPAQADYPVLKDQWIWDEDDDAPAPALSGRDYRRMVGPPALKDARRAKASLVASVPRQEAVAGRGVPSRALVRALVDTTGGEARDLVGRLRAQGLRHALVVLPAAGGPGLLEDRLGLSRRLVEEGIGIAFLVCQSRGLIREPGRWKAFASRLLREVGPSADWVSLGAGANTYRWGMTGRADFKTLFAPPPRATEGTPLFAPSVVAPVPDDAVGLYREAMEEARGRYAGQVLLLPPDQPGDAVAIRRQIAFARVVSQLPLVLVVKGAVSPSVLETLRSTEGVSEVVRPL